MAGEPEAYYEPDGPDRWLPTTATESPWDTAAQHGGPPAALAVHAMVAAAAAVDPTPMRTSRVSLEFLGTLPRRPMTVRATVARPGRRIRMLEAQLVVGDRAIALARAWQIATAPGTPAERPPVSAADVPPPVPPPQPQRWFPGLDRWGYGESIDWRWTAGAYDEAGPGAVWTRVRLPLVAGEPITGLERVLVVADSANGISGVLPSDRWLFVPPGVTMTVHRPPAGEWVHLAATTTLAGDGVASTVGILADASGPVGSVVQALLVTPR